MIQTRLVGKTVFLLWLSKHWVHSISLLVYTVTLYCRGKINHLKNAYKKYITTPVIFFFFLFCLWVLVTVGKDEMKE